MVFEKLSLLWKNDTHLVQEYREFDQMMSLNLGMFRRITDAIENNGNLSSMELEIYETDIKVNKLERKIRRALVTHLALTEGIDGAASLVLMSIVKDAERCGDYCKNLFELSEYSTKPISDYRFFDVYRDFMKYVDDVFVNTIKAFDEEDSALAAEVISDEVRWNKRFDKALRDLAKSDVPTDEAVTSALIIRTMKRLQAHLSNIASSVIQPVHRIDYRPKHLREKPKTSEDRKSVNPANPEKNT